MRRGTGPKAGADREVAGGELQAILFDMDGLLVDTEPLWFEVECAVMDRLGGTWTDADQQALVGGSLQRSVAYLLDRSAGPAGPGEVAGWLIDGMARLIAEREVLPMPGAIELYRQARAAGLPCALVTSSERVIMDAVLAGLADRGVWFDVTVCGADVRNPKPDPEPYQLAAALIGADPAHCVALEDSPHGVAAAEAAGCLTVAVPGLTPIPQRPGRLVAGSLAEIDLARLRGQARSRQAFSRTNARPASQRQTTARPTE
jgi:HAD superfamily hydrolase (TIGR01509 family)